MTAAALSGCLAGDKARLKAASFDLKQLGLGEMTFIADFQLKIK